MRIGLLFGVEAALAAGNMGAPARMDNALRLLICAEVVALDCAVPSLFIESHLCRHGGILAQKTQRAQHGSCVILALC